METFANVVMWIGLAGIGVSAVLFAAVWASDLILDRWRRARPAARAAFAAAVCLAALYGGSKSSISFPKTEERAYLTDNGSYVTNDWVHIDFTRQIVPDEAELVIERRQVAQTNDTDWAEFARSTFAEFAVPTNLPCANATNWNWIVYADWTPAPSVHTNGVLEVKWGVSRNDAAHRAAGLAVGIPVQTKIELDGKTLEVPSMEIDGEN